MSVILLSGRVKKGLKFCASSMSSGSQINVGKSCSLLLWMLVPLSLTAEVSATLVASRMLDVVTYLRTCERWRLKQTIAACWLTLQTSLLNYYNAPRLERHFTRLSRQSKYRIQNQIAFASSNSPNYRAILQHRNICNNARCPYRSKILDRDRVRHLTTTIPQLPLTLTPANR